MFLLQYRFSLLRECGRAFALLATGLVASCADFPKEAPLNIESTPLIETDAAVDEDAAALAAAQSDSQAEQRANVRPPQRIPVPQLGEDRLAEALEPGDVEPAPQPSVETVDAVVPPLALPAFIDVVFGEMLGVPYVTGEDVSARTDVIQLRSSGRMNADVFLELVRSSLEDYGVAIFPEGGVYRVIQDAELLARMPVFIRSRAKPSTPAALRPIVQFVELDAISANDMAGLLSQAFPADSNLKVEANPGVNSITLTGLPDDISAALDLIEQFDDLAYAGTDVFRYTPTFWQSTPLAAQLVDVLRAEGWQVSNNASVRRTILLLPIEVSNDLLVFARSREAMARTRFWIAELDRPAQLGDVPQIFIYQVENVDANLLAESARAILTGTAPQSASQAVGGAAGPDGGAAEGPAQSGANNIGGIVVDPLSNQLIFSGSASDYERLYPLLKRLDRAPPEVLIEVMIAEIQLNDSTSYGLEFLIDELSGSNIAWSVGSQGLGVGSTGLSVGVVNDRADVVLNLFAKNERVKVLSTPRLIARSGGAAQIQVGSDVPIITSQRAAASQDGIGGTDVLQAVEYRSTGVLLSIEPIVLGVSRVDLSISTEVSTALATATSAISSPTISNRTLNTQLSLDDGALAVLGGLIQDNTTRGQSGTPVLKDVPLLGRAFRSDSVERDRTELVVLIRAYVLTDSEAKSDLAKKLSREFNRASENAEDFSTLVPNKP